MSKSSRKYLELQEEKQDLLDKYGITKRLKKTMDSHDLLGKKK